MRVRWLLLTLLASAPAFAGDDDAHLPWDVRMPIRVGAGYSWAFDSPVADLSMEGVFTGRELFSGVRPELLVGMDGIVPGTIPITLPDDKGKVTTYGFERGHLGISLGLGLRFGSGDGLMVAASFMPSAVLSKVPGKIKDQDIGTVGAGLRWQIEAYPWFLDIRGHDHPGVGRWLLSSLGLWLAVRHDWADPERGGMVAGGLSIDFVRALMAPIIAP